MTAKEKFEKHIWEITKIYISAKESFRYAKYFYEPDTTQETEFAYKNIHIILIRKIIWRNCLTDLCKLVTKSDNDKYRFSALFNNLKPGGLYKSLKFEKSKIETWQKELLVNQVLIDKIILHRNVAYAHTDIDHEKTLLQNQISIKDVKLLLEICENIISDLFGHLDTGIIMETTQFKAQPLNILEVLSEAHYKPIKEMEAELAELKKKNKKVNAATS